MYIAIKKHCSSLPVAVDIIIKKNRNVPGTLS